VTRIGVMTCIDVTRFCGRLWGLCVRVCLGLPWQDFWSTDRGITAETLPELDRLVQFPVFAQGLVAAYNVPGIDSTDDPMLVCLKSPPTHSEALPL
jgi:hypothetical protein